MRVLQASSIAAAVEAKLYIRGKGYFGTLQPDGSVLPVRTCLDFMYLLRSKVAQQPVRFKLDGRPGLGGPFER